MNIGLIASIWIRVPPANHGFGAQEYLAALLADGLVAKGHEVTLFAAGDSETQAKLVSVTERPVQALDFPDPKVKDVFELMNVEAAIRRAGEFDVISNHLLPYGLPLAALSPVPVLHTLHHQIYPHRADRFLYEHYRAQPFVSISNALRVIFPSLNYVRTIYNGTDVSLYQYQPKPAGDYLVTMTRLKGYKGIHTAVDVAEQLSQPLKVAAPLPDSHQADYEEVMAYWRTVEPRFTGSIEYVGGVDGQAKLSLIANAKAFLFPVERDEPFGMTLIEAMACGTPVVAFGRGAVPEIVEDGVTGYLVDPAAGVAGFTKAVARLLALPSDQYQTMRQAARARVETHFSSTRMIDEYEALLQASSQSVRHHVG